MTNTYVQDQIAKVDVSSVTKKYDSIDELNRWGEFALQAGLIPQGTTLPQAMSIIQCGKEIGLQPMQSLRAMSFIKGRLTMSVQLQLALAKQRGVKIVDMKEEINSCEITLERNGEKITCSYTLEDAKKAGLVKQDGNYEKYLKQMLRWRATGDCLRMIAPDLVMGLLSPEEAESIETFAPAPSIEPHKPPTEPTQRPPFKGLPVVGISEITSKTGNTNGKAWVKYFITTSENETLSTFDKKIAEFAEKAKAEDFGVIITKETKGKYTNIVGMERMPEPDFSEPDFSETSMDEDDAQYVPS